MHYRNTAMLVNDLARHNDLIRIDSPVDPYLEVAAIQRRAYKAKAPALLFTKVKGTKFPMLANMFGTMERTHFIFRGELRRLEALLRAKAQPQDIFRHPLQYLDLPVTAYNSLPRTVHHAAILENTTTISALPQLTSWRDDGGAYITLPQVYTESPEHEGYMRSNLGMYRIQLSSPFLEQDREVGLHYQIHRGIGFHHAQAMRLGERLRVNIFVGGSPAMTLAAAMPLPEGISELTFAGALAGHRIPMIAPKDTLPMYADADFCISGELLDVQKPEGPFGDHLGYYSLRHNFPVMRVDRVWHRTGAIWPFTSVGRPPQEDTVIGQFIHDLTGVLVPQVFPGIHELHAVDAAGVHPLLLAIGSERYMPWAKENRQPQELLTSALALLGTTQTSLSKYLLIAARRDAPSLSCRNFEAFFDYMLKRTDFSRDLHFVTRTSMDTLDYTGIHLNQGSKLVWAACGEQRRALASERPGAFTVPQGFSNPTLFSRGIMMVQGPKHTTPRDEQAPEMLRFAEHIGSLEYIEGVPLVVVVDDPEFAAKSWENFLWVTFTRSDPATDIYGGGAFTHCKHWGCNGALIIDARAKSFHAPALEDDPDIERKVDALGVAGAPLHGWI